MEISFIDTYGVKVIPVHDQAPRHEDVEEAEKTQLHAFLRRSRPRWVVSFRSLPRFFLEKELPILDGYWFYAPQNRFGRGGGRYSL